MKMIQHVINKLIRVAGVAVLLGEFKAVNNDGLSQRFAQARRRRARVSGPPQRAHDQGPAPGAVLAPPDIGGLPGVAAEHL